MPPAVIQPTPQASIFSGAVRPGPTSALALGSASSSPQTGSGNAATELPSYFPMLGIGLAVFSSLLIGLSYVLQKRGMTRAQLSKRRKRATAAAAENATPRAPTSEPESPTAFLGTSRTLEAEGRESDVVIRIDHVEDDASQFQEMMGRPMTTDGSKAAEVQSSQDGRRNCAMSTSVVRPAAEVNGARSRRPSCSNDKHFAGRSARDAHEAGAPSPDPTKTKTPVRETVGATRRRRGPSYLYSRQWWFGTFLNLVGEAANLGAYAFTSAIVVAPLGALSVVVSAILSSFMLAERMNLQGKMGCALSLMGSTILVLNAPAQVATADMEAFSRAYFAPVFVVWNVIAVIGSLVLIFHIVPRFRSNALGYLGACSFLGSLSVIEIQAVATAVVGSIATHAGSSPTTSWLWWTVLFKAIVELVMQLYFLNEALARFSAVLVTPLYYAGFTSATLLANFLLNPPWSTLDARTAFTCFLAFAIICSGVLLLQTSKITTTTTTEVAALPAGPGGQVDGALCSGEAGHPGPTHILARQRSAMSFSHERLPSMRHSPLLPSSSIPTLALGASSSTLLPVPTSHPNEALILPPLTLHHVHLANPFSGSHARDPSMTSIMLSPFAPASAPAVTSSNIVHVHTREQPWLHTSGHFPELLSALMRALHSTMDEHDANTCGQVGSDSVSSSNGSDSDSVPVDKHASASSSGQQSSSSGASKKASPIAERLRSQSPGVTSISRRTRAMSWPGPGMAQVDVDALRRAASPVPDHSHTATTVPSVPTAPRSPQRPVPPARTENATEARRRAAALRGRLQSAMQLVQWLSSQVAAAGSSAAGSMAAGMNTASNLVRHHPPAPAPSPVHSTVQSPVTALPPTEDLPPNVPNLKAVESMALSDVKQPS